MTSIDDLMGRARERTGLDEMDGNSWEEGLALIVELLDDPRVSESGRARIENRIVDALSNRLRVADYARAHPEVRTEVIERPVFILGMPRTGTTVASYLIDQDPGRRSLLKWEAVDTVPPATTETLRTDPRCLKMLEDDAVILDFMTSAGMPVPHWEDADGPTECMFLHEQDFKGLLWDSFTPGTRYADWLLDECDVTSAYEYQKLVLQILQTGAPGSWVLKMPSHALHLDALLEVFPDARFVWAHRDPYKATGSLGNLLRLPAQMSLNEDAVDLAALGRNCVRQMREHVGRPLQVRARIGGHRFFDLHYAALMQDPIGQMRALYAWADIEMTTEVEEAMRAWLEENPQHKHGTSQYTLEEFGLTRGELEPVFADYLAAFDVAIEESG